MQTIWDSLCVFWFEANIFLVWVFFSYVVFERLTCFDRAEQCEVKSSFGIEGPSNGSSMSSMILLCNGRTVWGIMFEDVVNRELFLETVLRFSCKATVLFLIPIYWACSAFASGEITIESELTEIDFSWRVSWHIAQILTARFWDFASTICTWVQYTNCLVPSENFCVRIPKILATKGVLGPILLSAFMPLHNVQGFSHGSGTIDIIGAEGSKVRLVLRTWLSLRRAMRAWLCFCSFIKDKKAKQIEYGINKEPKERPNIREF